MLTLIKQFIKEFINMKTISFINIKLGYDLLSLIKEYKNIIDC